MFATKTTFEPTRYGNVLDLIYYTQHKLVDSVNVSELLVSSDHDQIHFNINVNKHEIHVKCKGGGTTEANVKI